MTALFVLAQATTTTEEEVPRVVGDPLPLWIVLGAAAVLLALILAGGLWLRRRDAGDGVTHGT